METKQVIGALSALAQETRLTIFRLLVEIGPPGLPVGVIADQLGLANATLSFHLKELTSAGLTIANPSGRSIIYSVNFAAIAALVQYLTENCCAGSVCAPSPTSATGCEAGQCVVSPKKKSPSTSKRSKS